MKVVNFNTGYQSKICLTIGMNYGLESNNYDQKRGRASKLSQSEIDKVRSSNINLGLNKFYGNTIYHTSFPWKK